MWVTSYYRSYDFDKALKALALIDKIQKHLAQKKEFKRKWYSKENTRPIVKQPIKKIIPVRRIAIFNLSRKQKRKSYIKQLNRKVA